MGKFRSVFRYYKACSKVFTTMCVLQVCANSCRLNIMVQRVPTQYELSFSVCHYQCIIIVMAPLPGYIFTVIHTLSAPFCMNHVLRVHTA